MVLGDVPLNFPGQVVLSESGYGETEPFHVRSFRQPLRPEGQAHEPYLAVLDKPVFQAQTS